MAKLESEIAEDTPSISIHREKNAGNEAVKIGAAIKTGGVVEGEVRRVLEGEDGGR